MSLPAIPERVEFIQTLHNFLPRYVCDSLQRDLNSPGWAARAKDESSMRYLFMATLEHYSLACPHPYRVTPDFMPPGSESFQCRMCLCFVIFDKDKRRN